MVLRWMVGCSFVLLLWLGFHANLPVSNSTWLGPVGENYTISPAGSGRSPFQDNARRHLHNRQNRSHAPHRAGTLQGKCGLKLLNQVVPWILVGPHPNWRALGRSFRLIQPARSAGRCSSESAKQKPALERRRTRRLAAGSNKRQAPDFRETFLRSVSYLYRKAGTVLSGDLSQNPGGQRRRPAGAQAPARRQSAMFSANRGLAMKTALISAMVLALLPVRAPAQGGAAPAKPAPSRSSAAAENAERWLHVRVISTDGRGETVRVNLPLELAEKVLPAVNHDRLHNGKVRIDPSEMNDVDLRALMEAIRTAKEGQYVTVEGDDNHVRVAKEGNHLTIHVRDKSASKKSQVEVKVPIKVIDALLSAGKDELDLVAALHALGAQGDTELVSVQDSENTVKVWLDSKNVAD